MAKSLMKFYIRTTRTTGSASLYTRSTRKGTNLVINTGIPVDIVLWGKCGCSLAEYAAKAADGVRVLEDAKSATQVIKDLINESKGDITSEVISAEVQETLGYSAKKIIKAARLAKASQLLPYMDRFIARIKGDIKPKLNQPNGRPYKPNSIRQYSVVRNYLADYLKDCMGDKKDISTFEFSDITKEWIDGFVGMLRERGVLIASVNRYVGVMRALCRKAAESGINNNTISLTAWHQQEEVDKRTEIALSDEEIESLCNLPLKGKQAVKRDVFVVGLLTGQRWSDFSRIEPGMFKDIDGKRIPASKIMEKFNNGELVVIDLIQEKTNIQVYIPCSEQLLSILSKYNFRVPYIEYHTLVKHGIRPIMKQLAEVCPSLMEEETTTLTAAERQMESEWSTLREKARKGTLTTKERQRYNYTKHVAEAHGLVDAKSGNIWEHPHGDMKLATKYRYEMVSSHTARRSFTTNSIKNGVPSRQIMSITGHQNPTNFKLYDKTGLGWNALQAAKSYAEAAARKNKPSEGAKEIPLGKAM